MPDHDDALWTRVRALEEALLRQDAVQKASIDLLVEQINTLRAVNTALVGVLSGRGLLDLAQMGTSALASLPEEFQGSNVGALISAMLTIEPA